MKKSLARSRSVGSPTSRGRQPGRQWFLLDIHSIHELHIFRLLPTDRAGEDPNRSSTARLIASTEMQSAIVFKRSATAIRNGHSNRMVTREMKQEILARVS